MEVRLVASPLQMAHRHYDFIGRTGGVERGGESAAVVLIGFGTFRINHLVGPETLFKSGKNRNDLVGLSLSVPRSEQVEPGVGERSDQRDLFPCGDRQRFLVVFQQHHRLAGHVAGRCEVCRFVKFFFGCLQVVVFVRIVEKTEREFHAQHFGAHDVDLFLRNHARFDEPFQETVVNVALQIHVDPGLDRQLAGQRAVGRYAVRNQFVDPGEVRHHETVESPLFAQDLLHQVLAGVGRHGVDIVECGHHRSYACVYGRLIRRQVGFAQRAVGEIHRIVIAPRFRSSVGGEMFYAGQDRRVGGERLGSRSLVALYHRDRDQRSEVGVFARPFRNASPARIAGDVHHRRERPVQPRCDRLARRYAGRVFDTLQIPRARHAEVDREDRFHAVDHVVAEQQRNVHPRFLDGNPLQFPVVFGNVRVENIAAGAVADRLFDVLGQCRAGRGEMARIEYELTDLLVERHQAHHRIDPAVDLPVGEEMPRSVGRYAAIGSHVTALRQQRRAGGKQDVFQVGHKFHFVYSMVLWLIVKPSRSSPRRMSFFFIKAFQTVALRWFSIITRIGPWSMAM